MRFTYFPFNKKEGIWRINAKTIWKLLLVNDVMECALQKKKTTPHFFPAFMVNQNVADLTVASNVWFIPSFLVLTARDAPFPQWHTSSFGFKWVYTKHTDAKKWSWSLLFCTGVKTGYAGRKFLKHSDVNLNAWWWQLLAFLDNGTERTSHHHIILWVTLNIYSGGRLRE